MASGRKEAKRDRQAIYRRKSALKYLGRVVQKYHDSTQLSHGLLHDVPLIFSTVYWGRTGKILNVL
jgi:hypothetical protein